MFAILSIALPVFGLIVTGAAAGRYKLLGGDVTGALNGFVVWLALPAVLFQAMTHIHPADMANGGLLAAFGLGIAIPFVLSLVWSRRQGTRLDESALHAMSATFCNVGYMGIPLCRMAFGDASIVPGVIIMVITACPQFAAAVILFELDRPGQSSPTRISPTRISLRRLTMRVGGALIRNPLLVWPVAGLAIALAGIELPLALDRFLTLLGGAATPCALVATGLMLTETTQRFQVALVSRLVAIKLLLQPAIVWVIAFHLVTMPPAWAETALLMSALPTGAGAFILARFYGLQSGPTSATVLVSTILSFLTLPVLLALLT